MKIMVTGAAGFIGFHTSKRLLAEGHSVIGIDNINDYYDVNLKLSRIKLLQDNSRFNFIKGSISDGAFVDEVFAAHKPDYVINLAAQAGVRYSIENPMAYIDSNIVGFMNILEACRNYKTKGLLYASSSSVYGGNTKQPFSVKDPVDKPISIYAATKRSNELMAHSYSHLFGLPTVGLRFFTVYGPYGRPDMALFLFTKAIIENQPIQVFNNGNMIRDFTYIDDIVEGIIRLIPVLDKLRTDEPATKKAEGKQKVEEASLAMPTTPYRLYNIGSNNPIQLEKYIEVIEQCLDKKAIRENLPMQLGDVFETNADVSELIEDTGYKPQTSIQAGISNFIKWYREYYGL